MMETIDYCFSFFRKPIQNIEPIRAVGIVDVYRLSSGIMPNHKPKTCGRCSLYPEAKKYKATHFDYCTFSGLFRKRNEKELIMHSGLMCLDFDHVENIEELKRQLLNHEYFDTELLFVSPSGNGLKWIIPVDLKGWEHSRYFKAVANCIKKNSLPLVDMSGSDVARSCFLPYDPQAYINHKYKDDVEENLFCPRLGECPF
ncbi:VirE N-terminal domain [Bacteroides pyogenes]|nr:VirE N-terminal domain [Bacteroides pyogenes]